MSFNQSRSDKSDTHYRKTGRSSGFNQQRGSSGANVKGGGGGPAPSPSINSGSSQPSNRKYVRVCDFFSLFVILFFYSTMGIEGCAFKIAFVELCCFDGEICGYRNWSSGVWVEIFCLFLIIIMTYSVLLTLLIACLSFKRSNNAHGGQSRVNPPTVNSAESNIASTGRTIPNGAYPQQLPGIFKVFFFWVNADSSLPLLSGSVIL